MLSALGMVALTTGVLEEPSLTLADEFFAHFYTRHGVATQAGKNVTFGIPEGELFELLINKNLGARLDLLNGDQHTRPIEIQYMLMEVGPQDHEIIIKRSPFDGARDNRALISYGGAGIKWLALSFLPILIGFVWCWFAERQSLLWIYRDRYVPAEFEVTRFYSKPRNSNARCRIEGVIHPFGEVIAASDEYIAIKHYDGPDDRRGREPTPSELEGQRLPVSYWPRQIEVQRWWYPPKVVTPGEIRPGNIVLGNVLGGGAFFGVGLFCFCRGIRNLRTAIAGQLRSPEYR